MEEFLVSLAAFAIYIGLALVIGLVIYVIRSSRILTGFVRLLGFLILALFFLFYLAFLSLFIGITIILQSYFFDPQFFANEVPITLENYYENLESIIKLAVSYALFYKITFFIMNLSLVKAPFAKIFLIIAEKISNIVHRGRKTASYVAAQLMALTAMFFIYPFILHYLFPELSLTILGNGILLIIVFFFDVVDRKVQREYRRGRYVDD